MARIAKNEHMRFLWICVIFSIAVLASSYYVELVVKLIPCHLCKLQRVPYILIGITPLLALKLNQKFVKALLACLFSLSLILATYHLLVIGGLINDLCAVSIKPTTFENFMEMLDAPVPCSKVEWKFLGMPIAFYNLAISVLFLVFTFRRRDSYC